MSRPPSGRALALALPAAVATLLATAAAPAHAVSSAPVAGPIAGAAPHDVLTGRPSDGRTTIVSPVDRSDRALSGSVARSSAQPGLYRSSSVLSTWVVHYTGFSQAAHDAFQRAVNTWAHTVASSVPIVVNADLTQFSDPAQLGGAGPAGYWGTPGVVAYPIALANAKDGTDHEPSTADIDAVFTNQPNTFYFGADPAGITTAQCVAPGGTTPTAGSCYDFESVVLHELGHGLGFLGSVSDGSGPTTPPRAISYGVENPGSSTTTPLVYDLYTETADGRSVLDRTNSSPELAAAVTGNALYWDGGNGSSADRGREPRLYAPSSWQEGSSYSHLSDASYPLGDADSLMTPYAEAGDAFRDPGEVMLGMFRDMGWVTPGLPGSRYTPVAPRRVLDTGSTKVPDGGTVDVRLLSSVVPSSATAVVLNVTAALPSAPSVVQVYPVPRSEGAPVPDATDLNTAANDQRANLVTVPLSLLGGPTSMKSGEVRLRNTGGAARLVADLAGYYAPAAASYFHTVSPSRLMDTRNGTGVRRGRVGQNGVVDLTVVGKLGVPTTATAVTLTLTAVTPTRPTYETAYPYGGSKPTVSNLNLGAGAVAANQVVVKVGSGGKVRFYNYAGTVDLVADLAGWYDGSASGGTRFRPTLPARVLDANDVAEPVLGGGAQDYWYPGKYNTSDYYGVPNTATSAVVNVTGYNASVGGDYLTVYPAGSRRPTASNVNLAKGQTAASLATVKLQSGGVTVFNYAGALKTTLDLQGWFGP